MEDQRIVIELITELVKEVKTLVCLLEVQVPYAKHGYNPWIDRQKVEKLLGISESTVKRYTANKRFKTKRFGKKYYYYEPQILEFLDEFLT